MASKTKQRPSKVEPLRPMRAPTTAAQLEPPKLIDGKLPPCELDGMPFEVTGTRLLVMIRPKDVEETTPGGLIIPRVEDPANVLHAARVLGVGHGRYNQMTGEFAGSIYVRGDVVLFQRVHEQFWQDIPGHDGILIIQEDLVRGRFPQTTKRQTK